MGVRSSQLVIDLEAAIAAAGDPIDADSLRADLAAQWARLGRMDEAEAMLNGLRQKYREASHPRLTPWLNFAEATIDLRAGRGPEALIKMRRAHAMSVAIGLTPLASHAAAWLAHLYWNAQDVDTAVRHAREALRGSPRNDHRTRCRVSLVVAEMLAMSCAVEEAKAWFARARQHIAAVGDDASRSALNFNLSAVSLASLKQVVFCEAEVENAERKAVIQDEVSQALDDLLKIPMDDKSALQHAQILSLRGHTRLALASYDKYLKASVIPSKVQRHAEWLSDEAWCHGRLRNVAQSLEKTELALSALAIDTQIDDQAAVHSRTSLVYALAGDGGEARHHDELASALWAQYRQFQQHCSALCLTITEDG